MRDGKSRWWAEAGPQAEHFVSGAARLYLYAYALIYM